MQATAHCLVEIFVTKGLYIVWLLSRLYTVRSIYMKVNKKQTEFYSDKVQDYP